MSTQPHGRKAAWAALSALGLAAAALIIPSCIQGQGGPAQTTAVTSRSPAAGSSNVSRVPVITVEFNDPILASTVTPSTLLLSNANGSVPTTVTFQPCNRVATLTPIDPLAPSTTYTVDTTPGIADPNGRSVKPDSFTFTTNASSDVTRPSFNGATSVTSPDVPTTTIPGSPTTIIPSNPVTTIPPTTIPNGTGGSVTIPGTSVTSPVTSIPPPVSTPAPTGPTGTNPAGTTALTTPSGTSTFGSTVTPSPSGTLSGAGTGGASGATTMLFAVATLSATVSWSPGSDNVDPASALVYDVFTSTMSGCYNFGAPTFTTAPGATSATLTNVQQGVPTFFVVRARDTSGNQDLNTNEVSLLPTQVQSVSFMNDVWPIVQAQCQNCHTQGIGAQQVPDMILSSPAETYASWVNVPAACPNLPAGTMRVRPNDHLSSFVWQKVSMDVPPCGARMPLSAPPLSSLEQQTIQNWIDLGAQNN